MPSTKREGGSAVAAIGSARPGPCSETRRAKRLPGITSETIGANSAASQSKTSRPVPDERTPLLSVFAAITSAAAPRRTRKKPQIAPEIVRERVSWRSSLRVTGFIAFAGLKGLKRLKGLKGFKVERVKGKVVLSISSVGIVHQLSLSTNRHCQQ